MLNRLLQTRLEPIVERYRQRRLSKVLAKYYAGAVVVIGVVWVLSAVMGWRESWLAPALGVMGLLGALGMRIRHGRQGVDVREVAREIEGENPRLHALLLTAVEQEADEKTGALNFLQERVVQEALEFNRQHPWSGRSYEHLFFARAMHGAALAGFVLVLTGLFLRAPLGMGGAVGGELLSGIEVTPGDASVERGEGLVVLARFGQQMPNDVVLVVTPVEGDETRIPLVRNLEDPVYGGRIPEVRRPLKYRVEYGAETTRDYEVNVYDLPRLERADAHMDYPEYTALADKVIENTRRVTAVEGTRVRYVMELNKPVASAAWVERGGEPVPLRMDATRSNVVELEFVLERNARYALHLTDEAGRTNRLGEQFVLEVFTNRPPELKLLAPRGDDRVSPLEEVSFRAQASDDFGLKSYGLGYRFGAGETEWMELGAGSERHEQKLFDRVVALEALAARPGQLLTYFLWADDTGPDGEARRSFSDIYFLEVRPFDEIFRENQSGAEGEQSGAQGQQGGPAEQLTELQKEIIAATWSLQRRSTPRMPPGFAEDVGVIRESQEHAAAQASELTGALNDPASQQWVEAALKEMERAVKELELATSEESVQPLGPALGAEQAAYEALLQLQSREFQIAQGQPGQGRGSAGGRMQRQLNQLQLKASEDRYEQQRQAGPQMDEQQREQLQFLSRLKELAQRQQDLNQRLRELELALQEAKTPEEREQVRRELRRLREQQQQMLSDVDELRQRMDRPDNQTATAEARQQLEETRAELQNASQAMEQGAVSQAVASGTRASRQLEELREDFRNRNASQFAEAMREMRGEARDLMERQERLSQELSALGEDRRPSLSDAQPREELAQRAARQAAGLTNLLDRVRRVTEESEAAEPLLSRELYETFRQALQTDSANLREVTEELLRQGALTRPVFDMLRFPDREGPGQSLAVTERLLREGHLEAARHLEEKAREDLGALQRGIERAAERILGDDTEALRLARSELDQLLEQLEQEVAEGFGAGETTNAVAAAGGRTAGPSESEDTPATAAGNASGQPGAGDEESREMAWSGEPGSGEESEAGDGSGQLAAAGQAGQSEGAASEGNGGSPADADGEGQRAGGGGARGGGSQEGTAMFFERLEAGGNERGGTNGGGPVTGTGYQDWVTRLGEVEELLESPDLRTEVARVRDRVRVTRSEFRRHGEPPQWDLVQMEMVGPLNEVRDRLTQELARRQSPEALVPIDRDLVPPRYTELVRRYYENLGATE